MWTGSNIYKGTASPYRLMYSLRERVLRLAACPDNSFEKLVFLNLDGFTNIECTDIDADPDPEKYYSTQRRKLILNVTNNKEKKSAERCMRTFSSYKRRTIYNKNNDTFTIEIDFYLFDKESIIRDILSLGSDIQVIEVRKPGMKKGEFVIDYENDIRGEVVAMLREMFNRL